MAHRAAFASARKLEYKRFKKRARHIYRLNANHRHKRGSKLQRSYALKVTEIFE